MAETAEDNVVPIRRRTPHTIPQARPDSVNFRRSGLRFGDLKPESLGSILVNYERGLMRDWADLCEYIVKSDPHLSSVYSTRKTLAARATWTVEPGKSDDPVMQALAEPAAKLATAALENVLDLSRAFHDMLDAIGVGVSMHEIDWHRDGREWMPRDLIWRHQNRFRWDEEYQLRLYDDAQRTSGVDQFGEELIPNKWIIHMPKEHSGYPTRQGVHLSTVWTWLFKTWAKKFYIGGLEKNGNPLIWAKINQNTPPEVRDRILSALENLSYDGVGVIEEGGEINVEALAAAMSDGEMHEKYLDRADAELTKNYLGAADAVEPGENGSLAAVESRTESNLSPRTEKDTLQLAETIQRDLFRPLMMFNPHLFGGGMPPLPKVVFVGQTAEKEIKPEVIQAGVVKVNELRASAGLEELDGEEGEAFIPSTAETAAQAQAAATAPSGPAPTQPSGGTGAVAPLARARPKSRKASPSSRTSSPSQSPLARALRGESAEPAKRSPKQLSIRWRR